MRHTSSGMSPMPKLDSKAHGPDLKKVYDKRDWHATGFRERTLEFLDLYCDYSMTLDMPLWARNKNGSQLRNLEVEQLIQLSVENLSFFADNRGRNFGKGTKFLSVLQGLDDASTDLWYNAVKGFEFEGWAFAGEPARLPNTMKLLRKMLDENKLDKTEWVHVLQNSPPIMTALYTAIQRSLSKALGHKITLSCDSSLSQSVQARQLPR